MKFQILLVVVIAFLGITGCKAELKLVTTVEGKSYYADNTRRGQNDNIEFCKSQGMEIASITSAQQENALDAAYNVPDFEHGYWILGDEEWECKYYASLPRGTSYIGLGTCDHTYRTLCQKPAN